MKMAVARTGIKDVARLAGVSVATVSKVFNPSRTTNIRMSESTRRRVLEAAEQLDYTPNYGATLLRGQSSHTIGFSLSLRRRWPPSGSLPGAFSRNTVPSKR